MQAAFNLRILDGGPIDGFVGFFDVQFRGSAENPADMEVGARSDALTIPDAMTATIGGVVSQGAASYLCRHTFFEGVPGDAAGAAEHGAGPERGHALGAADVLPGPHCEPPPGSHACSPL